MNLSKLLIGSPEEVEVARIHSKPGEKETRTIGWEKEEDEVLRACIAKYGVGNYKAIKQNLHLPFRTTSQLSNRTKVLLGIFATETFTGLNVDTERVRKDNAKKYGTAFYKNPTGVPKEADQIQYERERNRFMYQGELLIFRQFLFFGFHKFDVC